MKTMKLIQAELAKAHDLIDSADQLGLQRMELLDQLWENARQAAKIRHEIQVVYKRIDSLMPDDEEAEAPDEK